ncbi:MAG TPA: flavin reductase family protein [Methanocella sp.]|nr:flavin reductase family protein [Methanocella sp.]
MDKVQLGPQPFMGVMPAVLVGTNVDGKPNYMTAAWATVACMAPPMVCVAINHARHTMKGIDENGTFSLNIASTGQVAETDHCGLVTGARADKSKVFSSFYGALATAPMAGECPVNIECKVYKSVDCGSHELYIGEVAEVYVSKGCMAASGPDLAKIDPIVYAAGNYWQLGKQVGKAFSAGKHYKK